MEYVEFLEKPTKTCQSGLSAKPRSFILKMLATGDGRCPCNLQVVFVASSSPNTPNRPALSLSRQKYRSQVWFKRQPMGVNKINDTINPIVEGTTLESSSKVLSNLSARKKQCKEVKDLVGWSSCESDAPQKWEVLGWHGKWDENEQ